jgi:hypothetical protein
MCDTMVGKKSSVTICAQGTAMLRAQRGSIVGAAERIGRDGSRADGGLPAGGRRTGVVQSKRIVLAAALCKSEEHGVLRSGCSSALDNLDEH